MTLLWVLYQLSAQPGLTAYAKAAAVGLCLLELSSLWNDFRERHSPFFFFSIPAFGDLGPKPAKRILKFLCFLFIYLAVPGLPFTRMPQH